ncbi:MAG: VOC family protein [Anaerolineae bacterium]|jgi:PhnB protein|nr:VOC family protein [Chloroflexota bacterium]
MRSGNTSDAQATTIAPWLAVQGGARAVAFYAEAFGAVEIYHVESPDGAVVSRLSVQGAEFWLSDESPEHGNPSPLRLGASPVRIILTVADPDAMYARAVAAGARVVSPIAGEHGWRSGRLRDPFGHDWEIGRPIRE